MPTKPRRRDDPSPITRDIVRGRGGIAGGCFTTGPSDSLDQNAALYVLPDYIEATPAYVFRAN